MGETAGRHDPQGLDPTVNLGLEGLERPLRQGAQDHSRVEVDAPPGEQRQARELRLRVRLDVELDRDVLRPARGVQEPVGRLQRVLQVGRIDECIQVHSHGPRAPGFRGLLVLRGAGGRGLEAAQLVVVARGCRKTFLGRRGAPQAKHRARAQVIIDDVFNGDTPQPFPS